MSSVESNYDRHFLLLESGRYEAIIDPKNARSVELGRWRSRRTVERLGGKYRGEKGLEGELANPLFIVIFNTTTRFG